MSFKDHKNEQPQLRGQKTEKAAEQKAVAEDELEKEALSGPQIEENHVHLQTVLMLTQLNSVYYELALAFTKATTPLQNKYQKSKRQVFLKLSHFRSSWLDARAREREYYNQQRQRSRNQQAGQLQLKLMDEEKPFEVKYGSKGGSQQEMVKGIMALECKSKIARMVRILTGKRKGNLSCGLHRAMHAHDLLSATILSQKSSRIETNQTNNSHKSKYIKRSGQKSINNRKSFSLEKSDPSKRDYHIPVKYQRQRTEHEEGQVRQEERKPNNSPISSSLNRFLQDRGECRSGERRLTLMMGGDKKLTKSSSSKKMSMSMMTTEKEEKIRDLEYLRGKYKKLIDEFSWFSDRFLKVIEEEDIMQ